MQVFEITKERLVIGHKEETSVFDLLWLFMWIVAFAAIPFFGMGLLVLAGLVTLCMLLATIQVPRKLLIFDKNKNLLIIKSKLFLWHLTTQYALSEIVKAALTTKNIYAGSMTIIPLDVVQLIRRKQNTRTFQESIIYGMNANHNVVNQINKFLES
ncbi:MAG: hypothetical protein KME14_01040 [Tildeniella torsiva UHER 1998/13D]|jgi:hypothetical protein|nr:hypothetical protein [Tildeniella torsiva UHER 1998/13D]